MPISGIVTVKSLGTTGTRYASTITGTIPSSACVQYDAGIVGWHIPSLREDHDGIAKIYPASFYDCSTGSGPSTSCATRLVCKDATNMAVVQQASPLLLDAATLLLQAGSEASRISKRAACGTKPGRQAFFFNVVTNSLIRDRITKRLSGR